MDDEKEKVNEQYRNRLRRCHYCGEKPIIEDNGSAAQKIWYVECACGCRGPAGLVPDAVDGWEYI